MKKTFGSLRRFSLFIGLFAAPLPIGDFRKVDAVFVDVLFVLNELVAHLLVEISAAIAEVRQLEEHRLNEVETVDLVLDADVERGRDGAFLVITVNVEVVIVAAIG